MSSEAAIVALAIPPNDGRLVFTSVTMAANRAVNLQWNGDPGKAYTVLVSKTTSDFTAIGERRPPS